MLIPSQLPVAEFHRFTGRAATATLHDASATGVFISGIFQAAEDFAVLGQYNAYGYSNRFRLNTWRGRISPA